MRSSAEFMPAISGAIKLVTRAALQVSACRLFTDAVREFGLENEEVDLAEAALESYSILYNGA
jgi:hypothetical protein